MSIKFFQTLYLVLFFLVFVVSQNKANEWKPTSIRPWKKHHETISIFNFGTIENSTKNLLSNDETTLQPWAKTNLVHKLGIKTPEITVENKKDGLDNFFPFLIRKKRESGEKERETEVMESAVPYSSVTTKQVEENKREEFLSKVMDDINEKLRNRHGSTLQSNFDYNTDEIKPELLMIYSKPKENITNTKQDTGSDSGTNVESPTALPGGEKSTELKETSIPGGLPKIANTSNSVEKPEDKENIVKEILKKPLKLNEKGEKEEASSSSESAKIEESESAKIEESESAKIEESESAKIKESESAKIEESESAKIEESESAKIEESESAKIKESESAKIEESEDSKVAKKPIEEKGDPLGISPEKNETASDQKINNEESFKKILQEFKHYLNNQLKEKSKEESTFQHFLDCFLENYDFSGLDLKDAANYLENLIKDFSEKNLKVEELDHFLLSELFDDEFLGF